MFPLDVDSKGPSDRRGLGAGPDEQRTAVGNHPAQGHVGDASEPFAQRRIRRVSRFSTICSAASTRAPRIHGSYIREAYQNGLAMQDARGYNPYKFGIVGASDSHDTAVAYYAIELFRRPRAPRRHTAGSPERKGDSRSDDGFAQRVGPRRRLGRGEYARVDLRRHAAQGDVRHQRPAHQGAAVRRLGFRARRAEAKGLGQDRLCQRRADGRRSAGAKGQGADRSSCGPSRIPTTPISTASRSSRAGPRAARSSRRSMTSPGRAIGSSRALLIQNVLYGGNEMTLPPVGNTVDIKNATLHEHDRRGGIEDGVDGPGLRSEPARLLLRTGAADPDAALDHLRRQDAWAFRRRATCRRPFRIAPGPRRSGTRRRQRCAPRRRTARRLPISRNEARRRSTTRS